MRSLANFNMIFFWPTSFWKNIVAIRSDGEPSNATTLPKPPEFQTIYISGGKKNKLNKIDIVGFFSQKGKLEKGDLGFIEVKDFISFAAVKFNKIKDLLQNIRDEKMKGKKFKIEVARKVVKKEEETKNEKY